jgi:uncharacterized membrane protein
MPDEGSNQRLILLLPEPVRGLPADLSAVVGLVFFACLFVIVPGLKETPLRVVFGLPLVLFLPGYALVAALFPEAAPADGTDDRETVSSTDRKATEPDGEGGVTGHDSAESAGFLDDSLGAGQRGIDGIERVALSFGLSIAVVPLLGLVLNFTPWGIRLVPILVTLVGFTLAVTGVAAIRRRSLPADERFRVPYRQWIDAGRAELFAPASRLDAALNVLLVCSILLAAGSVAYAVAVPPDGESFTEFYILTEDENQELVAADYPSEFQVGESQPVVVGIGNHEGERVEYSIVVQLQRVETIGNETTILERQELDRFQSAAINDNETWQQQHAIQPTMTGERLRVQYLLYRDAPPASPTVKNAYRDLHLWIDVSDG